MTFSPESASDAAVDLLNEYNALLQAQGLPPIVATPANALWLIFLALGSKIQSQDELIAQAVNSFNLALSDDQQIVNFLPAAGTELIPGAFTSVILEVVAGAGTLTVPSGSVLPYGDVNFTTVSGITLPASGIGEVIALCNTLGPVVVGPNQLTSFSTSFPNLVSVTNPSAGVTGRNDETPTGARNRLIRGETIGWNLNGVQRAIGSISGITACKVYFNFDTQNNMVLEGGMAVLPRHALIVIAGTDTSGTEIASTYMGLMSAPTDGDQFQNYTFLSGQVVAVNFQEADEQNLWVRVFYDLDQDTQAGFESSIDQIIEALVFQIGQTVTQETICNALLGFQPAAIVGAEVSLDGVTYGNKVQADGTSVPVVFNVEVVGV